MTFQEFSATQPSLAEIGRQLGKSRAYLCHVQNRRRRVSKRLAVRVWKTYGVKLEPYTKASDDDMEVLERFA